MIIKIENEIIKQEIKSIMLEYNIVQKTNDLEGNYNIYYDFVHNKVISLLKSENNSDVQIKLIGLSRIDGYPMFFVSDNFQRQMKIYGVLNDDILDLNKYISIIRPLEDHMPKFNGK